MVRSTGDVEDVGRDRECTRRGAGSTRPGLHLQGLINVAAVAGRGRVRSGIVILIRCWIGIRRRDTDAVPIVVKVSGKSRRKRGIRYGCQWPRGRGFQVVEEVPRKLRPD